MLTSCNQSPEAEETSGNEITGQAIATEILRACKHPNGEFCEERCCQTEEKCEDGGFAYMECDLKAGEWIKKIYADSKCASECEIAKLGEGIKENKALKSCLEGWKCLNKFERIYRNSDCSFGETERCSAGCVNDTCANLCIPGAFSCRNDILRICDEDGNDWRYYMTCDYGCTNGQCLNSTAQLNQTSYGSVQIIDGDTIKLDSGETVRLIGINAPEKGQPYYIESSNRLKELLNNKKIVLEIDVDDKDQYGRLLRYILIDNENINIRLIKEGYATVYIVDPNKKYKTELENAWDDCMNNKINLCKPPESAPNVCDSSCIKVFELHYKAGDDCKNLNGEYVIFQNNCEFSCDLKDWTVKDESSRTPYSFPDLTLNKNDKATLYTGCGYNTNSNFYWCSKGYSCNAIWNNDKDTLYLRNSNNELILSCGYTSKLPPCQ